MWVYPPSHQVLWDKLVFPVIKPLQRQIDCYAGSERFIIMSWLKGGFISLSFGRDEFVIVE